MNEENLTSWPKGQSGNPEGKIPGTKNRSTVARKWLELQVDEVNPLTEIAEKLSYNDIITLGQIKKAMDEKDTNAYKALQDSAYGAPKQEMEHSGGVKIITIEQDPASEPLTDGTNGD